ncbi:MATE efflux family protein [Sesbania bispinosa]|nr:MATE efflux family protein [Sesbania bispinosa]
MFSNNTEVEDLVKDLTPLLSICVGWPSGAGWQAVAAYVECVCSITKVKKCESGYQCYWRRCLELEPTWTQMSLPNHNTRKAELAGEWPKERAWFIDPPENGPAAKMCAPISRSHRNLAVGEDVDALAL